MIEYTSLKRNCLLFEAEYKGAANRVIESGWYILGPELKAFEESFAKYIGIKHCIGLNSGTDALILAVRALGIGSMNSEVGGTGLDEVIVPAGTYIASVLGVTENGAKPVYVDSRTDTLLIDVSKIEEVITEHTKAILPVHLYGQTCDMDAIKAIADKYNLPVIEDCAQSHGSVWNGNLAGTQGTLACFSFYPTKPLGAFGDAGCIVTDDDDLADKIRMLRNYGSRLKYHNESIGRNSRLDEIQAAVLSVGLKHLDECNENRISIAKKYLSKINNPEITLPYTDSHATHVFHLFPIIVDNQKAFQDYMIQKGIKTQVHYPIPPYVAECYKDQGYTWGNYPNASFVAQHEVSLPLYSGMLEEDVETVIEAVNDYKG